MSNANGNTKPQYADVPNNKKTAAYSKVYYEKNKEKRQADAKLRSAQFRKEDPEKAKKRAHDFWHGKPKEERSKICDERRFKDRFKRSVEWYDATLIKQEGHCALCAFVPTTKRLHVDHSHACCEGRVTCGTCIRALLCSECNTKLGHLEAVLKQGTVVPKADTWLSKAMWYLDSYRIQ